TDVAPNGGYFDTPIWSGSTPPVAVAKRGSKAFREFQKQEKRIQHDVLVLGTEAGIDTALYWNGKTFALFQPNQEPGAGGPMSDNPYAGLRSMALGMMADALRLDGLTPDECYGLLMETGYDKAVVTLACFLTGDTSLYFSNGGGIIGAGKHASVADA